MGFSEIVTPLLCGISPLVLGWIILSAIAGIRGGWDAGIRLFLLGLGLLGGILAIVAIVFSLPDQLAVVLMLVGALLPWISVLRYFVASKISGKVVMTLSLKNEKWSSVILTGALVVFFGLILFVSNFDFLTPTKSYVLGFSFISLGIFGGVQRIRYSQIRENGILYEFGNFYEWENIENYVWKFGEDKLTLKLRKGRPKRTVNLKLPSQFRHEVVAYLSQKIDSSANNLPGYVPVEKAG